MSSITYKDAGVDIDAGNQLVKNISSMVGKTKRAGVIGGIGGFGGLFDLKAENFSDPVLVSGTDGVGTKLKIAIDAQKHNTIGIDLVAMCANDILVQGATPLFFMDYFATGSLDISVASEVVQSIVDGCQQAGTALLGGETAEMPDFYPKDHYDLAGFCVGAVERDQMLPKQESFEVGDIILGLPSSGFHANGYSLVRKIVTHSGLSYDDACPWAATQMLGENLLTPTIIYVNALLPLLKKGFVKGMAHITGGGLSENLPRIMPNHLAANINLSAWSLPDCFQWVQKQGNIEYAELLKTFNCGIGMAVIISQENFNAVSSLLKENNEDFVEIGRLCHKTDQMPNVSYLGQF